MSDITDRLEEALEKSDAALARVAHVLIPEAVYEIKRLRRPQAFEEIKADLAEENPEALLADGLEPALIGYTLNHHTQTRAVYDYARCVQVLVERDGLTPEDADEWLAFNTLGAWVGENGPLFIRTHNG